jgi:D-beta-D-heptose 7-phosphate kinase/D-beta-D-heptose 1-phosphate adenosyltransferase
MNLPDILTRAADLKIAVIGDFIEDVYVLGSVNRISPEAPVPVVNQQMMFSKPGGAGNVYMNLCNLGVKTALFCNTHDDFTLTSIAHHANGVVHKNINRHAVKTRVMDGSHHLLRIDDELDVQAIEWLPFTAYSWWKELEANMGQYNGIVLSDYSKGVLSDSLINAIMELAPKYNIPVVVDAKRNYERFKGATIVKCNQKEYDAMINWDVNTSKWLLVTDGESGIRSYSDKRMEIYQGHKVNIVDVCGAGDTVTAVIAMMTALNEDVQDGCGLANIAASEVCRHPGVHAISKEELINRWKEVNHE